jgi:hypothetical protein
MDTNLKWIMGSIERWNVVEICTTISTTIIFLKIFCTISRVAISRQTS